MFYQEAQREKKERAAFLRRRLQGRQRAFQEIDARRQINPHTDLRIVGRKVKLTRAPGGTDVEVLARKSLVPCPAEPPTLIDRFDGRALIDPIPKGGWDGDGADGHWGECSAPKRTEMPSQRDKAAASLANYEAYKDLIKLTRQGYSEDRGVEVSQLKLDVRLEWEAEEEAATDPCLTHSPYRWALRPWL